MYPITFKKRRAFYFLDCLRLMTRAIEIECSTWVSWDVYRTGAQSMWSKGKCQFPNTMVKDLGLRIRITGVNRR